MFFKINEDYTKFNNAIIIDIDRDDEIPEYNDRDYARIANQAINKIVVLPKSRKYSQHEYFITTINKIPRNIQQRITVKNATTWENMVRIYNFFADEFKYSKIVIPPKRIRIFDEKNCSYSVNDMVYMSDGMYIHKDDCWW